MFVGSYAQTIKDTAEKNAVPLLDLETASMEFVNNLEVNDWKNYWLVVDPKQYPFYKDQPGSLLLPDGTHFQEKGAKVMAGLLVSLIKQHPDLKDLSVYLNM